MDWTCPHCHKTFDFAKHQQKGAHITNCGANPKHADIGKAISASLTEPRIELTKSCPKCGTIFSQFRTAREIETGKNVAMFCSSECSHSREVSDTQKEKLSKALSGREFPERQIREIRNCAICSDTFECCPSTNKQTCGKKECFSKLLSVHLQGKTGGRRPKRSFVYNDIKLDSSWEVVLAKRLDALGIRWESSGKRHFPYQDIYGKMRRYFPDFYLLDYDIYIECKGAWTQEVVHKMRDVQNRNSFHLIILDSINMIRSFNITT